MINLLKKLNEPFPESPSYEEHLKTLVGISLFVTFFLYLFEPFEINTYPHDTFWICASFGLITFITSIIYDFIGEYFLKLQKDISSWTLWKWMVDMIGLVFFISIGNYLFITYFGWHTFQWSNFFMMLYSTFAVGFFPIIFSGMMIQMRANKKNQLQANNLQSNLPTQERTKVVNSITLTSQKNTQSLSVLMHELFYLEAMQNYVSICFIKDGKIEKTMFRNTIKQMEEQLENTSIIRCHRSFMVNTDLIKNVAGNAQGLRLSLANLSDFEVPVSRKYIPILKTKIS